MSPFTAPLRFMHASSLMLDHQLQDAGPLSEETRPIVEDATLRAFDGVVGACIDASVDFLLLTGKCVDEGDFSLMGRAALRSGFARLAKQDIPVFVVCEPDDWQCVSRTGTPLPHSVTTISSPFDEPAVFFRGGAVSVMIRWVQAADRKAELSVFDSRSDQNDERKPDGPPEFRIGLLDSAMRTSGRDEQNDPARDERRLQEILSRCKCDYLVLPFNGNRQTLTLNGRMAHHPGGIQGLSPFQTGPHGCTLVEIDPSRTAMNCSFIPTAPVRYERLTVEVNEETVRDDLMQQMTAALDGLRPAPTESVWLVEWTIRGNGPIAETIQQRALLQELIKLPELSAPFSGGPSLHHSFRIRLNDDASCRDAPLTAEFAKMVDRLPEVTAATLADLLAGVQLPEEPWGRRLRSQIGVLDQRAVESHVRRLGRLLIGRAGKDECR